MNITMDQLLRWTMTTPMNVVGESICRLEDKFELMNGANITAEELCQWVEREMSCTDPNEPVNLDKSSITENKLSLLSLLIQVRTDEAFVTERKGAPLDRYMKRLDYLMKNDTVLAMPVLEKKLNETLNTCQLIMDSLKVSRSPATVTNSFSPNTTFDDLKQRWCRAQEPKEESPTTVFSPGKTSK